MKTAESLLKLLNINFYTQRHLKVINDFITSGEDDVKILLDKLGGWDSHDLKLAEEWNKK